MTKEEILKSKIKSIYILKDDETKPLDNSTGVSIVNKKLFNDHFKKYEIFGPNSPSKMGQYFLYEKLLDGRYHSDIKHEHQLFYPKLGVYINGLPCDQTIEVEWVDYRRNWEWRVDYDYEHKGKTYQSLFAELPTEIERLPIWHDYLLIYGVWDSMPSWVELRQAYERTWWFHRTSDELRDIQLNRILKSKDE